MSILSSDNDGFDVAPIEIPADATTIEAIVRFLVQALVRNGQLRTDASDQLIGEILHREELGSTAVGRGVAVPHAQSDLITKPQFVLGRCAAPINWPESKDGLPVTKVCLFITPKSPEMRRKAMETAANLLRQ